MKEERSEMKCLLGTIMAIFSIVVAIAVAILVEYAIDRYEWSTGIEVHSLVHLLTPTIALILGCIVLAMGLELRSNNS